ncbi:MAG: glycosyltransferase family 4 protein [Alphaproteobacteria bacterium]|nr:glycosyltransferase family 4 protein [Alphaproteobacteria bacterium]
MSPFSLDLLAPASVTVVGAAALAALITRLSLPLLQRHALATPNARSSHKSPTPQGGGIAVTAATLVVAATIAAWYNVALSPALLLGALLMAGVGFADDVRSLAVGPRLAFQVLAVGLLVFSAPASQQLLPALPLVLERGLILFAGVWFVNLVNFMDGLDLMTVSEGVPVSLALVVAGLSGDLPSSATLLAAALCGALCGFAPFNRPVARIFLGDVGSLPIGLMLFWGLWQLAAHGHGAAALLLPAYYVADATLTLGLRIWRRERFWAAHRSHFYQRATDNGFPVSAVIRRTTLLNTALALLALLTIRVPSLAVAALALLAGTIAVGLTLRSFARHRAGP